MVVEIQSSERSDLLLRCGMLHTVHGYQAEVAFTDDSRMWLQRQQLLESPHRLPDNGT